MNFIQKLENAQKKLKSLVSVGLDPHMAHLPKRFLKQKYPQFSFNTWIIEETNKYCSVFKPQFAAYEARGSRGFEELEMTMEWVQKNYPDHILIADAKRGDIGSTNDEYAKAIFDHFGFDAITLHPYLGQEALEPFLKRREKGCIILCRTSNPGAGEFQDLRVHSSIPLWKQVATNIKDHWNQNNNCLLVVGATYPTELGELRKLVGEMPFLVPGIGAQGGDLEAVLKLGLNSQKAGLIIHASRSIIFAESPIDEAMKLSEQINTLAQ
ncbi:MAG: orotidine-5'-phosphate decarboxylase [Microgenomates group bacterium]